MTTIIQYWDGEKWQHENPVQEQGKLNLPASVAGAASANIPVGVAPNTPAVGDIWQDSLGLYYQNADDETIGPLISGSDIIALQEIHSTTKEPTGIPNASALTLAFNQGTREFSITPASGSYDYYFFGTKVNVSTVKSLTIPNTTETHFIYFSDANGTLTQSTTPWDIASTVQVAAIYWNATLGAGVVLEERHGVTMDWATHQYLHQNEGTRVISGFAASNYVLDSASDTDTTPDIASGVLADEDLKTTTAQLVAGSGAYKVWYRTGASGDWTWLSQDFPFTVGTTYLHYNQYTGGSWTRTELSSSQYVNMYCVGVPSVTAGFNVIFIMGQAVHATLAAAQQESISNLAIGVLPFTEMAALYRITFRTSNGYSNTGSCRIESFTRIVGTGVTINQSGINSHSGLSGLSDPNAHPATSISASTTNFNGVLSGTDLNVQLALDTLDNHTHTGATISGLDASDTTTGTFDIARIPTGTSGTTVSLGDHTHSYLSSSSSSTQSGYFGDIYLYDDSTPSHYLQITNSANLTLARTLSINVNDANRSVSLSGDLTVPSTASVSGTNTGDQTITLTGDITGSGTGSFATTLATVNSNVGSFGSATQVATFTVNAKGLITAASNTSIQIAQSQVTNLTTDLAAKATDSLVVHLAGAEYITGAKTFSMANAAAVNVRSNSSSSATPWIEVIGQRSDANNSASFSGQVGLAAVRTDTWAASGKVVGRIAFGQPTTFGDMDTIQYAASIAGYADGVPTGASNPTGIKFFTGSTPVAINAANVTAGTLALTIDSSGNTVLGPVATGAKLHLYKVSDTNTAYISSESGGGITFTTGTSSPTERMRIAATGDVSIFSTLELNGTTPLDLNAGSADHTYMRFYADYDNPTTRSGYFGYGTASSANMTLANEMAGGNLALNASGALTITTSNTDLSAAGAMSIYSATGTYPQIKLQNNTNSVTTGPNIYLEKNPAGGAAAVAGDDFGSIVFRGRTFDGGIAQGVSILGEADGTSVTTDTYVPGRLKFLTSPGGSTGATERMRIDHLGNVSIGAFTPTNIFGVKVATDTQMRYTAPGSGAAGIEAVTLTAGAYQPIVVGGSTVALQTGGTSRLSIDANGLFTGTGTSMGAWTDYSGSITLEQGSSGSLTKTVVYAKYVRIGQLVRYIVYLQATQAATGQAGNNVLISLPFTAPASMSGCHLGVGQYASAGTYYPCLASLNSSLTKVQLVRTDTTTANNSGMGANPSFAVASGDLIRFEVTYEIA